MFIASTPGDSFQYRQISPGTSGGDNVVSRPCWIKIQRAGNVLCGTSRPTE
jgi:hypothetical protein